MNIKKNKSNKKLLGFILVLTCVAVIFLIKIYVLDEFSSNGNRSYDNEIYNTDSNTFDNIDVGKGIVIESMGSYTGNFVEDGSDENVDDVFTIVVTNKSSSVLEYGEIIISISEESYCFNFSALDPGRAAYVLEKDRKVQPESTKDFQVKLYQAAFFSENPSIHSDVFKITDEEQKLTLKNISSKDITGDIYVYYKNVDDGIYLGGITYRAKLQQGLKAGEESWCYAGHYSTKKSEILFITYEE